MFERPLTTLFAAFFLTLVVGATTLGWTFWWQEKASCEAKWLGSIEKANAWWRQRLSEETEKLYEADVKGEEAIQTAFALRRENDELLAKQKKEVPLSDPCASCRVPWEWIWVRKEREPRSGS
jgi:hypothetical protein